MLSTRVKHPYRDAHNILPKLWQGSAPRPGRSVSRDGFQALVLAAEELQLPGKLFPGVRVAHAPLDDHYDPLTAHEWDVIISAANFVAHNVKRGRRTLVTCQAGLNRSGIITAMAVCLLTGAGGFDAVELVKKRRPDALNNTNFVYHVESVMA
jgi:protein-tyrosine phosphatase